MSYYRIREIQDSFKDSDIEFLRNNTDLNIKYSFRRNLVNEIGVIHIDHKHNVTSKIFPLGDEWFLLSTNDDKTVVSYQCDQLHGLVECIKNNIKC